MNPPIEVDEQELIEQARQGDRKAQGALYERYVEAVYRFMLYRTGNHELAEDLTAEVFSHMLTSIQRYEDMGVPFGAWLFRIARARLVDHWRSSKRRQRHNVAFSGDVEEFFLGAEAPKDPHDYQDLLHALEYLTDAEREIVLLRYASGLGNQDIASIVESNPNAVKSMMHRALKKLREILTRQQEFYVNTEGTEDGS